MLIRSAKYMIRFAAHVAITAVMAGAMAYGAFPVTASAQQAPAPTIAQRPSPTVDQGESNFFLRAIDDVLETGQQEATGIGIVRVLFRLFLAVLLSAILAFRPRRNVPLYQRNLTVSQTEILIAVVAAALMMIVGDNAARAFAIFAAVSLVRFRTNIKDTKEITVLLLSLALGLAAGVGRWELAIALCIFSVGLLWILEYREPEQVFRSMELTIKSSEIRKVRKSLDRILRKLKIESEVRELEPTDGDNTVGTIVYYLSLPLSIGTDELSERIFAAANSSIENIQWQHKKGRSKIFQ